MGIDVTPVLGPRTGVGVFVDGLLGELAGRPGLVVKGYGLTARGWRHIQAAVPAGIKTRRLPLPAGAALRAWAQVDAPTIEWWSGAVDVVHGTNFVVPPSRRAARLVTVHDLTSLHFPELCTPASLRYPGLVRRAVRRGAWVHAVSDAMAKEVVEHLGADPDRVRVIYSGVAQPTARAPGPTEPPYILALGTVEPRKDLPGLVAAFDRIAGDHPDLELRIAGPDGWGAHALDVAVGDARHRGRIKRMGWVTDREGLLAGAAVLAYPSLYEGFGFPPLEAMARGVPVVASTAGALPEVLGDAALLVAPHDIEALAGVLHRVLDDHPLRTALIDRGAQRVARYTWAATGDHMARLYREMAGR